MNGARSFSHLALLILFSTLAAAAPARPTLSLYVYDSLVAKGGLGPEIFPAFEKKCGCDLKVMPSGDGAQLLNRLQIDAERAKPSAQIVVGLDEPTFERGKPWLESWQGWQPNGLKELHPDLKKTDGFLPFDYGFFSFMADTQALAKIKLAVPTHFSDLLQPPWKRNVILEDPRTSTPGLAFVLFADRLEGDHVKEFWPKMRSQWLTLSQGWDSAYGLFLRGEAPLVWSYTTSQAYHEAHGDQPEHRRYAAVIFEEGQPMQVEGAALVKGAFPDNEAGHTQKKLAREFLEYLISAEVQDKIGARQWMYPARKSAAVPPSFKNVPSPKKVIHLDSKASDVSAALSRWTKEVEGAN